MKKIITLILVLIFFMPLGVKAEVRKGSVSALQEFIKNNLDVGLKGLYMKDVIFCYALMGNHY